MFLKVVQGLSSDRQQNVRMSFPRTLFFVFLLCVIGCCCCCTNVSASSSEQQQQQQQQQVKTLLPVPSSRLRLGRMLELFRKQRGAEIGVQRGQFSAHVLTDWTSCEYFLLVDPWEQQDESYTDSANINNLEQDTNYRETIRRMAFFGSVVDIQRTTSKEASLHVPDESLDFVYVDARHDYCSVKEDLELWWPKVRAGGFIAGHDFLDQDDVSRLSNFGVDWTLCPDGITRNHGLVKGAVLEFAAVRNLVVYNIEDQGDPPSFLIEKMYGSSV